MPAAPADVQLSFFARLWLALVCLVRVVFDPPFAAAVARLRAGALPAPAGGALPAAPGRDALQLLALLQREGRFVDFVQEDLAGFPDAQVGAAARAVHDGCRRALREHLTLAPVRSEPEGGQVALPQGFDAGAVRLTGNVVGAPPFTGVLRHHGWRAESLRLPATSGDPSVLAPAEVELP